MSWMPGAVKRDVGATATNRRFTNGPLRARLGVVLHCNDAQSDDLFVWITGNHDMSCHFQINKAGTVYQYISTDLSSWCQIDGNDTYLSIETQGVASEPMTAEQVNSLAKVVAWLNQEHGIPLQLAEAPGDRGLGWHGMGAAHGADWGHPACPGVRRNQRSEALSRAKALVTPVPPQPHTPYLRRPWPGLHAGNYFGLITGPAESHGGYYPSERLFITQIQQRLQATGDAPKTVGWADGRFEQPTVDAVKSFQRKRRLVVDGKVGPLTWKTLFTY